MEVEWDSGYCSLQLSSDNKHWVLSMVHCALMAWNITCCLWESHTVSVLPLGWIHHHCLTSERNCLFLVWDWDRLVPFPVHLHPILSWWLESDLLASSVPWMQPSPTIFVKIHPFNVRWGHQASLSQQAQGSHARLCMPINARDLLVTILFHQKFPSVWDMLVVCLQMEKVVVWCIH